MQFTSLLLTCPTCQHEHAKAIRSYSPSAFSNKPEVLSHTWCPQCRGPVLARYRFVELDGHIAATVVQYLEPAKVFTHPEPGDGIVYSMRHKQTGHNKNIRLPKRKKKLRKKRQPKQAATPQFEAAEELDLAEDTEAFLGVMECLI